MSTRYEVFTHTEGGHIIGYTVWDTHEDRPAFSDWVSSRWDRTRAQAEADRLNAKGATS